MLIIHLLFALNIVYKKLIYSSLCIYNLQILTIMICVRNEWYQKSFTFALDYKNEKERHHYIECINVSINRSSSYLSYR
jgi:hypothetical protein